MPQRSVTTTGVAGGGSLGGDHAEALARRGEREDVGLAVEGRAAAPSVGPQDVHPPGRRAPLRRAHALDAPWRSSGPTRTRCAVGELASGGEQELDALAGGDPADVEDDGRILGDAELAPQVGRLGRLARRLGKAVAAHVRPARRRTPHATTSSPLAARGDDDRRGTAGDAAVERRVERPLERHLAQPRPEHAERLEHVRDPARGAPRRRVPVVTGSRKPNTCTTSGRASRRERERAASA